MFPSRRSSQSLLDELFETKQIRLSSCYLRHKPQSRKWVHFRQFILDKDMSDSGSVFYTADAKVGKYRHILEKRLGRKLGDLNESN